MTKEILEMLPTVESVYRGALTLASPEVKFEIDTETHDPLDVGMYQVREANQMVEEMMLLANITVAEHILKHFPAQALLRRHPVPPPRQFDPLLKAAVAAGVSINPETSQVSESTQGCAKVVPRLLPKSFFDMQTSRSSRLYAVTPKGCFIKSIIYDVQLTIM